MSGVLQPVSMSQIPLISLITQESRKTRLPVWSVRFSEKRDQLGGPEQVNKAVFGPHMQEKGD